MANNEKKIFVYDDELFVGTLFINYIKGEETYSFEYDDSFLLLGKHDIDPMLPLYKGRQYSSNGLFGIFKDASPDRWGRALIKKKEAILANKEKRKPNKLYDSDFLLGVYDKTRMGKYRFKLDKDKEYLSNDNESIPPMTSLRTLEEASRRFEEGLDLDDKWINQLIKPGSSLGGARPKANVLDLKGELWIAKFPSKNDDYDVGAFEMLVNILAKKCEIEVSETRLEKFSDLGSTFLSKRFDRNKDLRIGLVSAMTLLEKDDGDDASYLDLVSLIKASSVDVKRDLLELYKRMVFNVAISNSDDHLRNHSFIITDKGYRLSPVYDINPIPYGNELSLSIDKYDKTMSKDLLQSVAKYFDLDDDKALSIINNIFTIVSSNWEDVGKKLMINRNQIEMLRCAFVKSGETNT